jgi:phosphatidylserine/phosphatidylglycerophosphate/cardiolipin synthase-like enzyme
VAFFPVGSHWVETAYARPEPGAEDPAILDRLTELIDATPPGGSIRGTIFRLTVESVRDALVAAQNRGVDVRIVHNGRDRFSEVAASLSRRPPHGLGPNHRWSGLDYDPENPVLDFGAIATGRFSDLHTKVFLFSLTADPEGRLRRHVSWWGSANLSHQSGMRKANDAVVVYEDPVLYEQFLFSLWELMWAGVHFPRNDFYAPRKGRGAFLASPALATKVFCSPEQDTDLWVNRLRSVVADERTRVSLAHVRFTDARLAVAEELVRIAGQGADVRVLAGAEEGLLGPAVRDRLESAGIPLLVGDIHDKLGLVESRYGLSTDVRKIVFSGSHNLNHDANWLNDEILVKTFSDPLYDDMLGHMDALWAGGRAVDSEVAPEPDFP